MTVYIQIETDLKVPAVRALSSSSGEAAENNGGVGDRGRRKILVRGVGENET